MNNIKTIEFSGELYRADNRTSINGISASNNYRNAPMKYFTLHKSETNTYTRYGKPFVKTWVVSQERPLVLIDIMNRHTRNSIRNSIGAQALNIAFPINEEGSVYRVSEENTKSMNDRVLGSICELGNYDGYIMNSQQNRKGVGSFHSEVGLCKHAFDKLKLVEAVRAAPPSLQRPTLKRRRYNNNTRNARSNNNTRRNIKNSRLVVPKFSFNNL